MPLFCNGELVMILEKQFEKIIFNHNKWLQSYGEFGSPLYIYDEEFCCDIDHANFHLAQFENCWFRCCDFTDCDFTKTQFSNCRFVECHFSGDFRDAHFFRTNLNGLDLSFAQNLEWATFKEECSYKNIQCPDTGSFIGWALAYHWGDLMLVKLEIPEDALRSSAADRVCRTNKAKVLDICLCNGAHVDFESAAAAQLNPIITFTVGETIEIKDFNQNRWRIDTPCIQFFITKQDAMDYYYG
jgi:hypothetical protein